ncbi:MAG: FAD-dependent oxidoreductase [Bacteroidota bacterium]|nr:FAD-dependent oxidoreductase [Bacteroidota bacterium]
MKKEVVILGGGVAGMSAAHELINRGFTVSVYELNNIAGGKARSTLVDDSASGNRKPLPGEHGFRFFPRFYKHITSTMKEIPFKNGKVYDNLVDTSEIRVARAGAKSLFMPAKCPTSLNQIKYFINKNAGVELGLNEDEKSFFAQRIWQLMTSCYERRKQEYERLSWWEFMEADRFSEAYKTYFVKGLTRTLVAARAEKVSTKTGGDILLQLTFDILKPGMSSDRILNGPTNEVWINPWLDYLQKKGVKYYFNHEVVELTCMQDKIITAKLKSGNNNIEIKADYFISALPVEKFATLINKEMKEIDPTLESIPALAQNVSWMNGLQLYLTKDIQINQGHTIYIDSPWAITSIAQNQFWADYDWTLIGDGTIKGLLSVDISNWESPGVIYGKAAKECNTTEIVQEVWTQLKQSLNVNGETILDDNDLHFWNLDTSIVTSVPAINKEPLLVNNAGSWALRPFAYTDIKNLFLASDYVKTNTDLATMEGANEAARRAVNAIIDASGANVPYCKIWDLKEPWFLAIFRWKDKIRYNKGLPWQVNLPWYIQLLANVLGWLLQLFAKINLLPGIKQFININKK